ncbi:MAG: Rod shape-determining protein MreD [Bacteroidota bacterium]
MSRSGLFHIIYFFLYLLAQVLLFKRLVLFDTSFCFLYVAFVLLLPIEINNLVLMLIGFLLGFCIDIFYDSLGLHALSLVLVAYLRNYWLAAITPQGGYEGGSSPTLAANGFQWFLVYAIPLVFVHHLLLFFTEAGGFSMFWFTMMKVMGSVVFTITVMVLLQYLSLPGRR